MWFYVWYYVIIGDGVIVHISIAHIMVTEKRQTHILIASGPRLPVHGIHWSPYIHIDSFPLTSNTYQGIWKNQLPLRQSFCLQLAGATLQIVAHWHGDFAIKVADTLSDPPSYWMQFEEGKYNHMINLRIWMIWGLHHCTNAKCFWRCSASKKVLHLDAPGLSWIQKMGSIGSMARIPDMGEKKQPEGVINRRPQWLKWTWLDIIQHPKKRSMVSGQSLGCLGCMSSKGPKVTEKETTMKFNGL